MRYRRLVLPGFVIALSLAGCSTGTGGTGGNPPPSPPAGGSATAPPPSPTPATRPDLTTKGLGPYVVGARLDALRTAGLAVNVRETPACPGIAAAQGTAAYGKPDLAFYQGALQYLSVTDPQVRTADGAHVSMPEAQVRAAYAGATDINNIQGGRGLMVQEGANALLFHIGTGVVSRIEAGLAEPLEFRFTEGEGC